MALKKNNIDENGMKITMIPSQEVRKKHILFVKDDKGTKIIEISNITKSKLGKHGSAKYNFTGINLINGRYYQFTEGCGVNMMLCELIKIPCKLIQIDTRDALIIALNEETAEIITFSMAKVSEEIIKEIEKNLLVVEKSNGFVRFDLIETSFFLTIRSITTKLD